MKKVLAVALILLLSVSLFGCTSGRNESQPQKEEQQKQDPQQTIEADKKEVLNVVESFGKKLQMVSLLAPQDAVKKSMQENYSDYVSQELLGEWQKNPLNAPGRLTSSPWPDHIAILSIEKLSEGAYEVKGEIIEITSEELTKGGIAAKRPITLTVKKSDNRWVIEAVTLGAYGVPDSISYNNIQYGFDFSLPKRWVGYMIVADKWEGLSSKDLSSSQFAETGPMISIRHPEWTSKNPRQDIPIMIFTLAQWNSLQQGEFHIGAAPIGPSELGRNSQYVFALPARYNFAFPTGYEEVENILKSNPLHPTEK